MSPAVSLETYVGSMVAVGLFAGLVIALIKYEWECSIRVAGVFATPTVLLGYLLAHGLSLALGIGLWTTLGGIATFFLFAVLVLEAGGANTRAGY